MSGDTRPMELTEVQAEGFQRVRDRGYPPLEEWERLVCDQFAAGLFLSKSICQWAYWNAHHGPQEQRRQAFRSILNILSGGRVKWADEARTSNVSSASNTTTKMRRS